MTLDAAIRAARPDGWRGVQAMENVIKAALFPLLGHNVVEVERIFALIKQPPQY